MKNELSNKKVIFGLTLFFLIMLLPMLYFKYKESNRNALLKFSKYNWGILIDKYSLVRGGKYIKILHYINGEKIESDEYNPKVCYGELEIGDTVFISYSVKDLKVVQLESCHWSRKKHWELIGRPVSK